jgi:hypothetical protein
MKEFTNQSFAYRSMEEDCKMFFREEKPLDAIIKSPVKILKATGKERPIDVDALIKDAKLLNYNIW